MRPVAAGELLNMPDRDQRITARLLRRDKPARRWPIFSLLSLVVLAAIVPIPIWWPYLSRPPDPVSRASVVALILVFCLMAFCAGHLVSKHTAFIVIMASCACGVVLVVGILV